MTSVRSGWGDAHASLMAAIELLVTSQVVIFHVEGHGRFLNDLAFTFWRGI